MAIVANKYILFRFFLALESYLAQQLASDLEEGEVALLSKALDAKKVVPARIHEDRFYNFWKDELKASPFILETLREGYSLPLSSWPPSSELPNNKSARDPRHKKFIEESLQQLLDSGAIVEVQSKPWLLLPLQVVDPPGRKRRLVVDGSRQLNPYLRERRCKLSHLPVANADVAPDSWCTTQDLTSGYYHLQVKKEHRQLLGCAFEFKGRRRYFVWQVAFLGISNLVWMFTKLLKPHVAYCRKNGVQVAVYIDDQRVISASKEDCVRDTRFAVNALYKAGWVLQPEKTSFSPVQRIMFLGLINDVKDRRYFFGFDRWQRLAGDLRWLRSQKRVKARRLAQIYGAVESLRLAVGPSIGLLSRTGKQVIARAKSWNLYIPVPELLVQEVDFLLENLPKLNGAPMACKGSAARSMVFASDASAIGLASVLIWSSGEDRWKVLPGRAICRRLLSVSEQDQSSTFRELLAIWEMTKRANEFPNARVLHLTDNMAVEVIMKKGSPKDHLQSLALDIFKGMATAGVDFEVRWRRRSHPALVLADEQSRWFDLQDWGLSKVEFERVKARFGPFSVDLFANEINAKCKRFFSIHPSKVAIGFDALCYSWAEEFFFACPPPNLVGATLRHSAVCKAKGILICPVWPSAPLWSALLPDGQHFVRCVAKVEIFHPELVQDDRIRSKTFSEVARSRFFLLVIDSSIANPLSSSSLSVSDFL